MEGAYSILCDYMSKNLDNNITIFESKWGGIFCNFVCQKL